MLQINIFRIKPEQEPRLREWLQGLNNRADEVRETLREETVRAEQAYIIPSSDGPILVYAMEAEDCARATERYMHSEHPIDIEAIETMRECLSQSLRLSPIYDIAI
jgi:hypothetical protein